MRAEQAEVKAKDALAFIEQIENEYQDRSVKTKHLLHQALAALEDVAAALQSEAEEEQAFLLTNYKGQVA